MGQCMNNSVSQVRAAGRILLAKPKQVQRLVLPPFLLAMALQAWLSVQLTGQVWPDLPRDAPLFYDLAVRGSLGLTLAVMGLLWHRAIYFGPRAPLSAALALGYWGQGALLSLLAATPFIPLALLTLPGMSIFVADALSLWLVLTFGVIVARRAGGEVLGWRNAWASARAGSAVLLALALALSIQAQSAAVAAVFALHSGAAFLLDAVLSFGLILAVLTLMARPGSARI